MVPTVNVADHITAPNVAVARMLSCNVPEATNMQTGAEKPFASRASRIAIGTSYSCIAADAAEPGRGLSVYALNSVDSHVF